MFWSLLSYRERVCVCVVYVHACMVMHMCMHPCVEVRVDVGWNSPVCLGWLHLNFVKTCLPSLTLGFQMCASSAVCGCWRTELKSSVTATH